MKLLKPLRLLSPKGTRSALAKPARRAYASLRYARNDIVINFRADLLIDILNQEQVKLFRNTGNIT